jgi:hypothetical protein
MPLYCPRPPQPVHVPADHMDTIIKIKTLKAKLFEYLPHTVCDAAAYCIVDCG